MRYPVILFFALLFVSCNIYGQATEDNGMQPGDLSLRLKNLNFIKDDEYFNNIGPSKFVLISSIPGYYDKSVWNEGYTLLGYFVQPELVWTVSDKITLRAGIYLLKYSGTGKFTQVSPVFSTTFRLLKSTTLTLGSLAGCDSHKLFDPTFSNERLYTNYTEDGLQLTSSFKHIFNDTYLSWENFVFENDTTREIINFAESFRYTSAPVAKIFQFVIPFQIQFKHFGGQINNYPEHMETYFNLTTGMRINIDIDEKRFGQVGFEYLQFINKTFANIPPSGITKGNASWWRFHYTYKALYIGAAYWKAHDFFAPNGNSIYGSVINPYETYVIPDRKVITNSIFLTYLPESYLTILFGFESYYDVCQKRLDYALTLHLDFDKLIKLATLKH
jgi:hypothetical protein